jgi:hypothetical protein
MTASGVIGQPRCPKLTRGVYSQSSRFSSDTQFRFIPEPRRWHVRQGAHNPTSPFVNLAQAATCEATSAENPANFRPYRWGTGGEPLPQKQHKKAAKAHRIAR